MLGRSWWSNVFRAQRNPSLTGCMSNAFAEELQAGKLSQFAATSVQICLFARLQLCQDVRDLLYIWGLQRPCDSRFGCTTAESTCMLGKSALMNSHYSACSMQPLPLACTALPCLACALRTAIRVQSESASIMWPQKCKTYGCKYQQRHHHDQTHQQTTVLHHRRCTICSMLHTGQAKLTGRHRNKLCYRRRMPT